MFIQRLCTRSCSLLVVAEEDLDWQPSVTADLESVWESAQRLHLLISQLPAVELVVVLDPAGCNTLRYDRISALQSPHQEDLCSGLALALSNLSKSLVLGKGRVGGAKAGVGGAVDTLLFAVLEELRRRVVGVQLNLVDGWNGLARGVVEEDLEVLDAEVGNTNVLDTARSGELLELTPGVDEVPALMVLLEVGRVGGRWPVLTEVRLVRDVKLHYFAYHQVEVDVVGAERLEGRLNALLDALVPWVVKLGGDPDLLTGDTRVLDTETDLVLVAVGKSSVNVPVASEESGLDGVADLVRLALPGSQTNSWDLSTLRNMLASCSGSVAWAVKSVISCDCKNHRSWRQWHYLQC